MPISITEGNRRPHDPVQAAKFASKAGVLVRCEITILMHWKHYKGERPSVVHCAKFVERLNICMGIAS